MELPFIIAMQLDMGLEGSLCIGTTCYIVIAVFLAVSIGIGLGRVNGQFLASMDLRYEFIPIANQVVIKFLGVLGPNLNMQVKFGLGLSWIRWAQFWILRFTWNLGLGRFRI